VETLFNLFLWGTAGALALAPLGAAFGAVVGLTAHLGGKTAEPGWVQAVGRRALGGALFVAAVGFFIGAMIGRDAPLLEDGMAHLAGVFAAVLALMLLAGLFAGLAYFCIWLGVRGTGLLLSLGLALGYCGLWAGRMGVGGAVIALGTSAIGLTGLALVLCFRLRSPYKQHAFEPTLDDELEPPTTTRTAPWE
jgi:hypothetical protein